MSVFLFIREKVDIFDVVSKRVVLRRLGSYWKGSCPFHPETDASFTISPEKKIFYCFGCHQGGDVIAFVAKSENLSQLEAVEFLAKEFSIKIPQELIAQSWAELKNNDEFARQKEACSIFAAWTRQQLENSPNARKYLEMRGIDNVSVERFGIGFFPEPEEKFLDLFLKYAYKNNVLGQDLVKAGILAPRGQEFWTPFSGRITFPIRDIDGKIVGFGGRIISEGDKRPKYYNSKETEIFHKGSTLFGFDLARHWIRKSEIGFLVEGYIDCVIMSQSGFHESFATLGTAFTQNQIKMISRFLKTLYLVYDADRAGEQAALNLAKKCWDVEVDLKVIILPPGHDPASFLSADGDLRALLDGALGIFEFFVKRTGEKFVGVSVCKKLSMVREVIQAISQLTDLVKRDLLLLEASRIFQIPISSLKKELTGRSTPVKKEDCLNDGDGLGDIVSQLFFIFICAKKDGLDGFELDSVLETALSERMKMILTFFEQNDGNEIKSKKIDDLLSILEEDSRTWLLTGMLRTEQNVDIGLFLKLTQEFKKRNLKKIILGARQKVAGGNLSGSYEQSNVLRQICGLSKKIRSGGI